MAPVLTTLCRDNFHPVDKNSGPWSEVIHPKSLKELVLKPELKPNFLIPGFRFLKTPPRMLNDAVVESLDFGASLAGSNPSDAGYWLCHLEQFT